MFFFLFPVVSTTFAAVRTFLRYVPPAGLGWLIIDEAGQSPPQAAIGALLKCQKALVVGDPLQLEPILTLPTAIADPLYEFFKPSIASSHYYNPFANSVQTLADRTHRWGALIHTDQKIGCPLRVHRRCSNPMFDLANAIAYEGKMILGKDAAVPVHTELGASTWFHLDGPAQGAKGHWVKEQGDFVLDLLKRLRKHPKQPLDDVYVIAPFREVISEFKSEARKAAKSWNHDFDLTPSWLNHSVGTVHTFQGKEASIVILILGLDRKTQYAAQKMIGTKPNLLNVATTRAKKHFYIVGNVDIWKHVFGFDTASELLPVQRL